MNKLLKQNLSVNQTSSYIKVGPEYFLFLNIPKKNGQVERCFFPWEINRIIGMHGADVINHIPEYSAFCNVPSHTNFEQVIDDFFNVYKQLDYFPCQQPVTDSDCSNTLNFIKHIFGENIIEFTNPVTNEKRSIPLFEIGLDYIQLLYQNPAQKLPILCLVSKENNTGKTTFGKLLKQILGGNCAIVGNRDLVSYFNENWATKALVICEENIINNNRIIEKVNSISTSDKIIFCVRGIIPVEIDCFIKFIFLTNSKNDFIKLNEDNPRYWIINVPVVADNNSYLINDLVDEIPAFISFINQRKLVTEKLNRMWFHQDLLKSYTLSNV